MALSDTAQSIVARSVGATCAALLIAIVPKFEGTVQHTYYDPVPIVTACTGHTGPELHIGETFTKEECDQMLAADLVRTADGIKECIDVPLNPNQLAAYVSFAFNVGVDAFCHSTMHVKLNGGDYTGACNELSRWVMAGGKVMTGIVRRREAERQLCLKVTT